MLSSAMLLAVLLLPVALAALCTCPSSPSSFEDSSVCGSDGRTYSTECQLQCAGLPGLSVAHPGPCAPPQVTASRRRRYLVGYPEWSKCRADRQCAPPHWGNCSECSADDEECGRMCAWNCVCGCAGLPTGGLDGETHDRCYKCWGERGCSESKRDECKKNCDNQFCRNLCHMDWWRCGCGCVQHVADTRTSTTRAPTTSTTTAPTTSTTTPPVTGGSATAATNSTLTASAAALGPLPGVTTTKDQRANQLAGAAGPAVSVNLTWGSGGVLVLVCVCVLVIVRVCERVLCMLVRWHTSVVNFSLGGDQRLIALCRVGTPAAERTPTKETNRDDVELNSYPRHDA